MQSKPFSIQTLTYFLLIAVLLPACTSQKPLFTFGLVADPQYANKPNSNDSPSARHYNRSLVKLQEAVEVFNQAEVDFVQTLGDVIDEKWESFDSIVPIYQQLDPGIKSYHVLGNHDFAVDSVKMKDVISTLSMPASYYAYQHKGWRFIALDANDYSFLANPLYQHEKSAVEAYFQQAEGQSNQQTWNGAIGKEQQEWLKSELESAQQQGQRVILFSHMPIQPQGAMHNIWNDQEVSSLIENYPNVLAFINGHNHAGEYVQEKGIHHITIFGMVDTPIASYAIAEVYKDKVVIKGYGHQEEITMNLSE